MNYVFQINLEISVLRSLLLICLFRESVIVVVVFVLFAAIKLAKFMVFCDSLNNLNYP